MAKQKSAEATVTIPGRFSYEHVFEPYKGDNAAKAKYSVSLLIDKKDEKAIAKFKKAVEAAKADGIANGVFKKTDKLKLPLRDGDEEKSDLDGYPGHVFISASSDTKPGVVDENLNPILNTTEFYSGCYGRANINCYAFNTNGNKGIAVGLNHVQKLKDGEALGGRVSIEEAFTDEDDLTA